jgi:hypothetical protein
VPVSVLPLPVVPLWVPAAGAQAYIRGKLKMDIAKNPFAIKVLTLLSILCITVSWLNRLGSIIGIEFDLLNKKMVSGSARPRDHLCLNY